MKALKTKLALLLTCSSLLVPSVVSAATTDDTEAPMYIYKEGFIQTNVHGIYVPGHYINIDDDTRVAFLPGGIGIIAVDKDTVLPEGSKYLN
ncbi:hypothetical protein [Paenibacillus hexagrammi]|uniref:Uncharacterized protein n=1 Tax=Paenibacillus hexagrammi TaxID=2908839 RepID=A0ABY3SLJ7_9BACL|nr:hypothetical protein [Paenibacillus sp. YPD9-1]UJF34415.1 hypothetical protein L0M14_04250 [Paenibacillus sp. YPD9-1]